MSYHPVLTASGTDKTLKLRKREDHDETSPKSGERCQLLKTAANKCKKNQDSSVLEMKMNPGGLFVFLLFILLNVMSGKVMDSCVLLNLDKSEFVLYSCLVFNITRDGLSQKM